MTKQLLISTSVLVCLACGGGASTTPAAATTTPGTSQQYQIVLHRPFKVGDRFRVSVDARESIEGAMTNSSADRASSNAINHDLKLTLVGTVTIREIDGVGRATSALLEVEQFKTTDSGETLLPPGTSIDAVRGKGEFSLMVNGQPRPDLLKSLQLAFPLHRPSSPLGDELFGTTTPRQVGESWTFEKSSVAKNLLEDGYTVRETGITGDTRLTGTTSVNGIECLELGVNVHADQAGVGEGFDMQAVGNGKLDSTIKMVVPVDPKLPLAMEEATTRGEFEIHLQDDAAASHTGVIITRHRRALYTSISK